MRSRSFAALAAGLMALAGCDPDRDAPAGDPTIDPGPHVASSEPSVACAEPPDAAGPVEEVRTGGVAAVLANAPLAGVSAGPKGFEATLDTNEGPRRVTVWMGTRRAPIPGGRALAFAHLAGELGLDVVPPAARRSLALAAVAPLAREAASSADDALAILNDGTVAAVVATLGTAEAGDVWAPLRAPRPVYFASMAEREGWLEQVASAHPLPGEDAHALRAFVGALVLDFLAAHILRRDVLIAERAHGEGSTLVLADNAEAFPPHADPRAVDRLLAPLREVRRFPRGLLDRLRQLDRERLDRLFDPGPFEAMLLSPRDRLELRERIETLTSLIEARVDRSTAGDPAAAVLAL